MNDNRKLRVGITQGDPNGVGYEVILKALEDNRILELCTPVIYGSAKIASFYRKALGIGQMQFNQVASAAESRDEQYNIVNVTAEDFKPEPGVSSAAAGVAAIDALDAAVNDLREGTIDILVTAPINKHNIHSERFNYPGHTEYLEAITGKESGKALMILCNDMMRVALVSIHLPLSKVAEAVTRETVAEKIEVFDRALRRDFGVQRPRIAVLSLNPHAGDEGLIGKEETEIIVPAIEDVRKKNIEAFGPYAADGFFGHGSFRKFDGVLAMYHDQGLAPFKALTCGGGVNYTAGLDIVRTSPDHGTAYDIAGKGEAEADSMREAIYTAIDICRNRLRYDNARRNPLRKQYVEKNKADNVVLDLTKSTDDQ